jgi:hypothetical protein
MFHQENANKCYTKVGLAAGTTTTLTSANAAQFSIMGKSYLKAAASNEATPTTDALTGAAFLPIAAGRGGVFTICRDSGGNLKVVQGQVVDLSPLGQFVHAPWFGPQSNDLAPVGYITVKAATGATTWTFGSSNLAGPPSNVTFAFVDCAGGMPARPQIA